MKNFIYFLLAFALVGFMAACGGDGDSSATASKSATKTETSTPSASNDAAASSDKTGKNVPPSQRVDMVNKGVGPVTNVEIPAEIDRKLAVEGKQLFTSKGCTACHQPDKTLIGPAPKGVLDIRTPEWVMNMIMNPDQMLAEDPLAKELQDEFNGQIMTDQGVSESEARALLEYFRTL